MLGALLCMGLMWAGAVTVMSQTPPTLVEVSGTVIDGNGEAVPKAKVILRRKDGAKEQTTTSDTAGAFRFARVASGTYEVEVQKEAFKPAVIQLSVGAHAPAPLHIALGVADLREEIMVSNESGQVNTNPAENLDVIKLDRDALNNLPVLGNDVVGAVANLVDASSTGSGGATVLVDGLETTSKIPANM